MADDLDLVVGSGWSVYSFFLLCPRRGLILSAENEGARLEA